MEKNNQQNETLVAEQEFLSIGPSTNSFVLWKRHQRFLRLDLAQTRT